MGKLDQSGVVVKPASPPGKVRRFPWRLWLWALLMTAAAGAGGYFTWFFKDKADSAVGNEAETLKKFDDKDKALATCTKSVADKTTEAATCVTKRDELDKTNKTLATQLSTNKDQLTELAKIVEQNKSQLDAAKEFQQQFAKMIDSGAIKVTTRHGNLVLSLPAEESVPSGVATVRRRQGQGLRDRVHAQGQGSEGREGQERPLPRDRALRQPAAQGLCLQGQLGAVCGTRADGDARAGKAGMKPDLLPSGAGGHDPSCRTRRSRARTGHRIGIVLLRPSPAAQPTEKKQK
jgi:hypothetical protein